MGHESSTFVVIQLVLAKVREARTMARCSCVSREWRQVASDENLWEDICISLWPSLKFGAGKQMIGERGYRVFFATLMRLDFQLVPKLGPSPPATGLHDLLFFLDILLEGKKVFSLVEEAQELVVKSTNAGVKPGVVLNEVFRFWAPFTGLWTESEIVEMETTWTVVEKKTLKSIKFVQGQKGRMVGSSIIVEASLPRLSCLWHFPTLGGRAVVELKFARMGDDGLVARSVDMGTLNSHDWCTYQNKDQALTYLDLLFSKEFVSV